MGLVFEEAILNKPLVGSQEWTADSSQGGEDQQGSEVAGIGQSDSSQQNDQGEGASSGPKTTSTKTDATHRGTRPPV